MTKTEWKIIWINALSNRGVSRDKAMALFQIAYGSSSIDLASDPIKAAAALSPSFIASIQ